MLPPGSGGGLYLKMGPSSWKVRCKSRWKFSEPFSFQTCSTLTHLLPGLWGMASKGSTALGTREALAPSARARHSDSQGPAIRMSAFALKAIPLSPPPPFSPVLLSGLEARAGQLDGVTGDTVPGLGQGTQGGGQGQRKRKEMDGHLGPQLRKRCSWVVCRAGAVSKLGTEWGCQGPPPSPVGQRSWWMRPLSYQEMRGALDIFIPPHRNLRRRGREGRGGLHQAQEPLAWGLLFSSPVQVAGVYT